MNPGAVIAEKYRLARLLGEGAMGAVWEAENLATGRLFAVKIMSRQIAESPEMQERMLREAKATGRISNRNVVATYDVGRTETGEPFLVMELLRGCALDQYLSSRGALPPHEAVAIATEIARGLAAAHAVGIVHRDLKPANVFLHQDPDLGMVVKVVDFGVSKAVDSSTGTITGVAIGSPAYMSPEQARGEKGLDARSDVWALGVVLFEMLTGRRPFDGETAYDVVAEILKGPIPRLAETAPGVDPRLDQVVAACLVRDRDGRISTAEGVLMALGAPTRGTIPSGPQLPLVDMRAGTMGAKPTTTVGQSLGAGRVEREPKDRRPAVYALAGAGAVVFLALVGWGVSGIARGPTAAAQAAGAGGTGGSAGASGEHTGGASGTGGSLSASVAGAAGFGGDGSAGAGGAGGRGGAAGKNAAGRGGGSRCASHCFLDAGGRCQMKLGKHTVPCDK